MSNHPPQGGASRTERLRAWAAAHDVDRVDVVFGVGLVLLLAGLWLAVGAWLGGVAGLGVALTVAGVLLVVLAMLGARSPAPPATETEGD